MLSRTIGAGSRPGCALYLPFLAPYYLAGPGRAHSTVPWYQELTSQKRPVSPAAASTTGPVSFAPARRKASDNNAALRAADLSEIVAVGSVPLASSERGPLRTEAISKRLQSFFDSLQVGRSQSHLHLHTALNSWKLIADAGILAVFGARDFTRASTLLSSLVAASVTEDISNDDLAYLEEVAIHLAVRDAPDTLLALLVLLLRKSRTDAIDGVLYRFHTRWSKPFDDSDSTTRSNPVALQDDYLSHFSTNSVELPLEPRGASDMLTIAIVAHAASSDFQGAMRIALDLGYHLQPKSSSVVLPSLGLERAHLVRTQHYFAHARTAILARDPQRFIEKIQALQALGKGLLPAIHKLYRTVVEGLGADYPWATLTSSSKPGRSILINEHVFAQFIRAFCFARRLDLVEQVWEDLSRFGHKPTVVIWTALIHGGGVAKGADYAQRLWDSMAAAGVRPDSLTYHGLISAYVRAKRMREASAHFSELNALIAASPSIADNSSPELLYNTMLLGHLEARQHDDALRILKRMEQHRPAPTVATYNTLMAHYNRVGDYKSVSWVLKKIVAAGLRADEFTYSTLLCALLAVEKREDAVKRVLSIMRKHGVQPNAVMYSTIIAHLLMQRTLDALFGAMDVLKWMENSPQPELAPTLITYTNVLQSLHSWDDLPTDALESCTTHVLTQMRTRKIEFTKVTYAILIKACFWNNRPESTQVGLRYFRNMQAQGPPVTADIWYLVIQGLARRNEWALADEVVTEMMETQVTRNEQGGERDWLMRLARKVKEHRTIEGGDFDDIY